MIKCFFHISKNSPKFVHAVEYANHRFVNLRENEVPSGHQFVICESVVVDDTTWKLEGNKIVCE